MSDSPENGSDPDKRLHALERDVQDALARRDAAQRAEDARETSVRANRGASAAWRIMLNLVLATVLFGAVGYWIDGLTGLAPLGLLVGLLGGFALGVWGAARTATALQAQNRGDDPPG